MTDWGVHLMDYAIFGMNADVPKTVSALGGNFAYPDLSRKHQIQWEHYMSLINSI